MLLKLAVLVGVVLLQVVHQHGLWLMLVAVILMAMAFVMIMKMQDVQILMIALMIQQPQMMMGLVQEYLLVHAKSVLQQQQQLVVHVQTLKVGKIIQVTLAQVGLVIARVMLTLMDLDMAVLMVLMF